MRFKIHMRLEARACGIGDAVPWQQMRGAVPLTDDERVLFIGYTGYKLKDSVLLVRFDECRIFAQDGDLAVCLYAYARSFAPSARRGLDSTTYGE